MRSTTAPRRPPAHDSYTQTYIVLNRQSLLLFVMAEGDKAEGQKVGKMLLCRPDQKNKLDNIKIKDSECWYVNDWPNVA